MKVSITTRNCIEGNDKESIIELTDEVLILILLDVVTVPCSFSRHEASSVEMALAEMDDFTAGCG